MNGKAERAIVVVLIWPAFLLLDAACAGTSPTGATGAVGYTLVTIDSLALPAARCPANNPSCGFVVEAGALTVLTDSTVHYVERYRTSATAPDSVIDAILPYQPSPVEPSPPVLLITRPGTPAGAIAVDTGFFASDRSRFSLFARRGSRRYAYGYRTP